MIRFSGRHIVLVLGLLYMGGASCSNNGNGNKAGKPGDTVVWAPGGVNLRKGKIWEKENVVKIPLTAAENELKGQVKLVAYRDYEYDEEDGGGGPELADSGYNLYDKTGYLLEQNEYYADKSPKWHCLYKYDSQHKPNEWNLMIDEDEMNSKTTFVYDAKGKKTEEITADPNTEFVRRNTYKYDNKGNQTGISMYDHTGKLKQTIAYVYDQRGFQTVYVEADADGEVIHKLTCAYDDNGNKISGADYSSDTALEGKWMQKNDAMGRRIETAYFSAGGKLMAKRTIKYDEKGYAIEYNTTKADGSRDEEKSYSYVNEYDHTGNILKQTEIRWKGGKRMPVSYSEYVVTYY
jgi:hypothetical protein